MKFAVHSLLLLILLLMAGCTSDENNEGYPFPNEPTPDFSCTMNDHPWVADSAFFTRTENRIVITAFRGGNPSMRISLTGTTSGVYPILQGTNDLVYSTTAATESKATSGDIFVSDYDASEGKITGTFDHLTVTGTAGWYSINDGYFINVQEKR